MLFIYFVRARLLQHMDIIPDGILVPRIGKIRHDVVHLILMNSRRLLDYQLQLLVAIQATSSTNMIGEFGTDNEILDMLTKPLEGFHGEEKYYYDTETT